MENKPSMSRVERLHREKVTRYSIRKYSFGAASVAVAALFMFLGNGAVSANELSKQETSVEATTPTLDKTQLESYISEIETKLSNGSYANKTEESVALLKADLESAKATLANATTQAELKKAYSKLVTTANSKLRNKPVEKKETPAVDTTEGKETVGKSAENTEKKPDSNSIENTGSNDARNGKELDKNNAFRTEATAATHEATTNKVGNISYTMEFSDDAKKEIYLYNQEDTNIDITVNSTAGNISSVKVRGGGNRPLDEATKDSAVQIDGFGWSYTQTLTETAGPVTMNITGKTNERFLGLTPTNRREDQNSVLGDRYLVVTDTAGGSVSASSNGSNQPGFFKLVVKSQTYKYDIKDLTEERRITVNDIDNITPTELASIKSRLKLEYSKKSNDARFVRGATVANPTSLIDTVAVSTTEPSKLVVTYKDGSVDTIEKSKVLNVKPVGIIPFSNPTAKEIYVYKGEETNIEFGVTDDSGKIKDLRIVQGSAIMGASGAEKGQVRNEYGLTMTSETNANGIEATTANPAITRITGTVDVLGKPKFVGPLMTRYLVAEDLDGALFSNPDANKNMDQEGAFKLVVREQTQKYDVQLQGAESNKIAVADVNNLSAEDFEKIKNNIKIVYNTADDARLKDKDETRHGSLVKNASQYIQSITNSGNNIVVTYKDGSTDTIEKTSVLRSAPGPVVTKTARANGSLNEDGIYSTDRTLKGTGTPGATIKVSVKDEQDPTQLRTLYDNVTVGTDGNWSVDLTHGLYSNITNQTQLYPREPLSVTQTVNGLESVETVVSVALGDSKVLPSEASKDGASVVAGSNKLVVKVPHDAGIAYVDYKNKETDARSELAFKRENKDSQWTMKDASKATITSVTSDGFYDTVTLEMKEKIKEGTDVRVVSNIYDGKYSSPVSWVSTPVSNEKPTLTSANGQTETTVNVGDTVNPVDFVTAADHEDDKNATLGTKGTTEVVSVNGDETVKTIDTTTAGSYVVKYKVVDSQGKESDVLTHTVIVNLNKQPAIDAVTQAATAQIEKINGNTAATKEEKDAAIAKVNNDKQAAIDAINAGTVKTQDALTKAQNAGTTAISADNPVVAKKDAAKADVEAARKAKEDAIKANPNLTQAEKDAAIAKNNTAAADATKAIDTATTNDAVDQAKTAGTTAIGKVNPVAKENAKEAIANALTAKNSEIDKRTDLSDAEKKAAKDEAQKLADAELAKINAQPDNADTPETAAAAQKLVAGAENKGVADVKAVNPVAKEEAKKAVAAELAKKESEIDGRTDLTTEEKEAAKKDAQAKAKAATDAIDAQPAITDSAEKATAAQKAVDAAKDKGVADVKAVDPVAAKKPAAKKAIDDALTAKNNEIDARTDLTPEEKTKAKEIAKAKADAAKDAVDKATTDAEVDKAKTDGTTAVANVTPVAKEAAKTAIADALTAKNKAIDARTDLTDEEKTAAKNEAKDKADAQLSEIAKQPDAADTPEAAKTAQDAVDAAKKTGVDEVTAVNPAAVKKTEAKQAIDDALTAKNNAIDARTDLTDAEKKVAKDKATEEAKKAKETIDAATTDAAVDTAKTAGLDEVAKVNPVAKEAAKKVVADELDKKEAEIDARTDLTKEEKDAAKKDAQDKAKSATDAINAQPDNADTPEKAAEAQKAVDTAKKTGVDEVAAVNPEAVTKPVAKKAIDDKLAEQLKAIENTPDATDEEKKVAADAAKALAEEAKKAIDKAGTDAEVKQLQDEAKKEIEKSVPVVEDKPNARKAIDDEATAKKAAIDARDDLTPKAKEDLKAQVDKIAEQAKKSVDAAKTAEAVNGIEESDKAAIKAVGEVNIPADKVLVNDPSALTDDEKAKVLEAVKKVNPDAKEITQDADGNITVTTPDGHQEIITPEQVVKTADTANDPKAGNDVVKPADKVVVNDPAKLTDAEKEKIKAAVETVNPNSVVTVDEKGNAKVSTPDGQTQVIPVEELVRTVEDTKKPNAGNDIVKPADKTVVANPDALTPEEKKAIEDKVKAVNPGSTVAVDDKGNATVTTPEGKTAVIPATDLTKSAADAAKPNAGNDIVKPADKTVVANPDALTPEEKKAIEDKVKAVNPDATVVVDDKGNATVTTPEGKTAVIPASDLTKSAADAAKPNAGNDIVKPADKTVVANPDKLTDAEKKAIEDKVKAVNPGSTVVVDDKGNATVTTPEGNTAVIPASDLTKSAADAAKANAGNAVNTPAAKVEVKDPAKLTDEEKAKVKEAIEAVNPGSKVVVDDKGNATVTTPEGNTAVIPAADVTKSAADAAKANAGNTVNTPAAKVEVKDPANLTDAEKKAIEDKVKAVNPGSKVVVDDKGNATVTTPEGKTATIPAADVTKSAADAGKENAGNGANTPATKTVVKDPANLTDEEKAKVKKAVEDVNPGSTVVVNDKGDAIVTKGDGTVLVIPELDLVIPEDRLTDPTQQNGVNTPATRVLVGDKAKLTADEIEKVKESIKAVNPGSTVVVDENGNATVTTPEGKTATIPAAQLVKDAKDVAAKNNGENINVDFEKETVADLNNLTDAEKEAAKAKIKGANADVVEVIFDKAGNATVITKDGKVYTIVSKDIFKQRSSTDNGSSANTGQIVSEHTNARKGAKELPYTGTADSTVAMVAAAASALLGLGLAGRRRKEDEEA